MVATLFRLREITYTVRDVHSAPSILPKCLIRSPEDAARFVRPYFDGQAKERFLVLLLDSANHVQCVNIVSEGILNSSLVHPREVFAPAIHELTASVILAHNHPSGSPEPSSEDLQVTRQLVETGKIIGIPVHDHLIIFNGGFTSFAERSLI